MIIRAYENNILKSIKVLDDMTLMLQIQECWNTKDLFIKSLSYELMGEKLTKEEKKKLDDVDYYITHFDWLMEYCYQLAEEYRYRTGEDYWLADQIAIARPESFDKCKGYYQDDKGYVIGNTDKLFQDYLVHLWDNKRKPFWTKRNIPDFYKKDLTN